ncbi:MAG: hypothetical protein CMP12_04110 [Zunongwangia sp.]|uniref:LVIVD repeat-containing protein n=1 Tax=Zunongwangia profunda TaxID=398743 RepID=A0A3D5IVF1_9FLAO|nr:hypothetical protein [Zunongwangia profunda]MAO35091.1 hypothetical protein [Zunongwangia sp.]MAS71509.1 hypothetical protein [Zunongwangia sp.]HAJ82309.1 hypothetical protein [Zunongwangia profunda]HCV79767.1 hypothetical protein [Zunongwangia profunda]|tara:strand:+ start:9435 stop:11099 length:1665 start_codon:yes stop_codon:yes gene_type:complete
MSKRLLAGWIILSILVISCSDSNNNFDENEYTQENFKINNDAGTLENVLNRNGAGVLSISSITAIKANRSKQAVEDEDPQVSNIALEQIATVDPPIVDGTTLRASHVKIDGNYAYVTYMMEGEAYLGGVDIINIEDKTNPFVTSRVTSDIVDFTSAYFSNGRLYFASAVDTDELLNLEYRANLGYVNVSAGNFLQNFQLKPIEGNVAVDISGFDDKIIGVSGATGVLGLYDAVSLETIAEQPIPDLRSIAYGNNKIAVLSGSEGLAMYNPGDLSVLNRINTPNLASESKRTIAFKDQAILVAEGGNGVGIYDSNSGNTLQQLSIPLPVDAAYDSEDVVTNAVSIAGDFILMANGGAGFGIAKLDENNTLVEEGIVDLEGSSNYIQSDGDYIFVASGTGGLKIIKVSQPEATDNFAACESYDVYRGNSNLNVNSNQVMAYRGAATLKNLNVGGDFTFCGSINIQNSTNINSQGTFNMRGAMAVGIFGRNHDLNINSGSVLRIEGTLVVYGNLNLNSGSTLEFVGNGSRIHVFGNVRQNSGSTVIGNYIDTSNKLK